MTITFFTNRLNHHQAPVADELYAILGSQYAFVETSKPSVASNKGSKEDFSSRPYLIQAWRDNESFDVAKRLAIDSEVAVFGAQSLQFEIERVRNTDKLTFDLSERWLKRGVISLFSPRLIKHQWYYHTLFKKKPVYKLCASAYAARDQYLLGSFKNRCFKWGYFSKGGIKDSVIDRNNDAPISIMWCARYLKLKHPVFPILLADILKKKGYVFTLDMYGDGQEYERTVSLSRKLGVDDVVRFHGFLPNQEIMDEMSKHQIFLFTSDRNEGWGVVANEAMSCGCVLVADQSIGSTPYLIKHRITGCAYKSGSLDSLAEEVMWLFDNDGQRSAISNNGRKWIEEYWNPKNAAKSLLQLCDYLSHNGHPISEGPCSQA